MKNILHWIRQNPLPVFFAILGAISITALSLFIINFFDNGISKQPSDWATFATYVSGTIGTLIGLISIILLYRTLKSQTELSRLQQFESSFFSLLANQRDIVKSIGGRVSYITENHRAFDSEVEGLDFMHKIADAIEVQFKKEVGPKDYIYTNYKFSELNNLEICQEYVRPRFFSIYDQHKAQLSHYLRHLYHTIKYVEGSKIENRRKYIDIIQSQMSDDELYITMLYVISSLIAEKFYKLVLDYQFFENIITRDQKFDKIREIAFPNTIFKSSSPKLPSRLL